jgi:hypothetical protein
MPVGTGVHATAYRQAEGKRLPDGRPPDVNTIARDDCKIAIGPRTPEAGEIELQPDQACSAETDPKTVSSSPICARRRGSSFASATAT